MLLLKEGHCMLPDSKSVKGKTHRGKVRSPSMKPGQKEDKNVSKERMRVEGFKNLISQEGYLKSYIWCQFPSIGKSEPEQ